MKILLVEDDEATSTLLVSALVDDRHMVNIATDGQMGRMLAETYDYDLLLLDVLVPKLDGISLCRQLRSSGLQMPILLLTARDSQTDKIVGLDAGADDYVVKPFDIEELKARIRALLRRRTVPLATVLTWEELCLDPDAGAVTYHGHPIALTPKEFSILELLLRNPHRVFSRSAMIDRLWSLEESPAESAVTTHIKDLRQKLKAGGMTVDLIDTVYGLGYRLKSPTGKEQGAHQAAEFNARAPQRKNIGAVHQVIEKFKDSFLAQIAVLQQAETAMRDGNLTSALREQSKQEAHKLAGSLGTFGYANGTQLARSAEALLANETMPPSQMLQEFAPLVAALQQELASPSVMQTHPPLNCSTLAAKDSSAEAYGHEETPHSLASVAPVTSGLMGQRLVLLMSDNQVLIEQLQSVALPLVQIQPVTSLETILPDVDRSPPDVILFDLSLADSLESGLSLLAKLTHYHPDKPVLVISEQDSLSDRVEVSRLGGKAFLPQPVTVEQILQAIHQSISYSVTDAKVLIVDDDPATLIALRYVLQPWGLQVTTLNQPQQFWETLMDTKPDLVVFDLEMPVFSGIDLCQVVRHDPYWGDLPILVVTSHTDANSIRAVFAAGADDFVAKPVVGPELVTRILSRIERVRRRNASIASRRIGLQ